MGTKSKLSRIW